MSSLAQEESRSISENTTWGKRKQFADGKGSVAYSWFLGYDKDFKINEEQAATVRLIYRLFISGLSLYTITKELESRGIKSPSGKDRWHISTVKSILTNEKYRGDSRFQELEALIQEKNDTKEILTNFITKLEDLTGEQTEFREELWGGLVDHIRIDEKSSMVVFRSGIEITI